MTKTELWWNGPTWLADPDKWPPGIASEQSNAERKVQRELSVVGGINYLDTILSLRKAMRVFGWVLLFTHKSRSPSETISGSLTTDEIAARENFWVERSEQQASESEKFLEDNEQLNLQ